MGRLISVVVVLVVVLFFAGVTSAKNDFAKIPFPEGSTFQFECSGTNPGEIPAIEGAKRAYYKAFPKKALSRSAFNARLKQIQVQTNIQTQLRQAKGTLKQLINQYPEAYPDAYFARGVVYLLGMELPEALADFNTALRGGTKCHEAATGAYFSLLYFWPKLARSQRVEWTNQIAGTIGEWLASRTDKVPGDFLMIADLYRRIETQGLAFVVVEMAAEKYPGESKLLFAKSLLLAEMGDKENAAMIMEGLEGPQPGIDKAMHALRTALQSK